MPSSSRFPVYFVSHGGGPWPWMEDRRAAFARTVREIGALPQRLPAPPKAVLVITGHWEAPQFMVSTAAWPAMDYDYYGFPEHTYQLQYPAPGSPALAQRVRGLLQEAGLPCGEDPERGFDHGTFVPLYLMYPDADVPVVLLSMKSGYDPREHLQAGQALQPLRDEGVLILGSGLTYHNMRGFNQDASTAPATAFEDWLNQAVTQPDARQRNEMLAHWAQAPAARLAHPREDHLIPLLVAAGAAGEDIGHRLFVDHVMKVPMASYEFGG
jgi:aromatic ring-opening dioxygenase catalytic subunit (LigB family)